MTISTANYTSSGNSKIITIENELSSSALISEVNTQIGNLGWSMYDNYLVGNVPGTGTINTDFSPMNTYVFRAQNADGVTWKYLIMRWDIIRRYFWTSTCESWNTSTHVPTNECWTNLGAFIHGYDLIDGRIIISATQRHFVIWSFIAGQPGMWSMVCEFERVAEEDTTGAGWPCWAWTCSLMIGTPFGTTTSAATSRAMFAFPRVVGNITGFSAARLFAPCTTRGMWPPVLPVGGTLTITVDTNLLHLGSAWNVPYGWNTSETIMSPVSIEHIDNSVHFGRIYSLGITGPIADNAEHFSINLDSSGGWPTGGTGSSSPVMALPMNSGWYGNMAYSSSQSTANYAQFPTGVYPIEIAPIGGGRVVIGTNTGIFFTDVLSLMPSVANINALTSIYSDSQGIFDIIFDGEQYVYAATSDGVLRINVSNSNPNAWTTSLLPITNGTGYLSIDKKYVYATSRKTSTTPTCTMILRSNFTNAGTHTFGTAVAAATVFATPQSDYNGTVYVTTNAAGGFALIPRIGKFLADTPSTNSSAVCPYRTTSATWTTTSVIFWMDPTTGTIYNHFVRPAASGQSISYTIATNLAGTLLSGTITNGCSGGSYYGTMTGNYGEGYAYPYKGIINSNTKFPNQTGNGTNSSGFWDKNPISTGTLALDVMASYTANSQISAGPRGAATTVETDGVYLYAGLTVTQNTDSRLYFISDNYRNKNAAGGTTGMLLVKS